MKKDKSGQQKKLKQFAIIFTVVLTFVVLARTHFFCSQANASCGNIQTNEHTSTQIASQYFTYTQQKLAESLSQGQTVVLYFYAPWCSTCTSFDQELKNQHGQLPQNVDVLQIDYDSAVQLKKQYSVTYQHTLVLLDQQGKVREMWIGGDLNALLDYLKKNP